MEGVVLKTYFKYKKSLQYRGHVKLDIRLADGKKLAIAEGQKELKKFNKRSDEFQNKIIDVIKDPNKTIEQKIEESNIIYSQNLNSAGSLSSKIDCNSELVILA